MIEELKKGIWPPALSRNHPALTAEEQVRLLDSRVVVVGLGGLGGHLATLMARAGVGELVLVDDDSFEPSNLNRQALANTSTLGRSKAHVAGEQCRLINPEMKTQVWETRFTGENGWDILNSADVVLDGLDKVDTRKALFSQAMSLKIPFVHGAVSGWCGQTSTFLPQEAITLDNIYSGGSYSLPPPPVLAPVVAIIAGIQTMEAIRILCGRTPANVGTLVLFDGADISLQKISLGQSR